MFDNSNWKMFVRYFKPHILHFLLATIAVIATSGLVISSGIWLQRLMDEGLYNFTDGALVDSVINLLGIIFILSVSMFTRIYFLNLLGCNFIYNIQQDIFLNLIKQSQSFFEKHKASCIVSSIVADSTIIHTFCTSNLPFSLRSIITLVGSIIMLVITNIKLTLIAIVAFPTITCAIIFLIRRARNYNKVYNEKSSKIADHMFQVINNIRVVQAFMREDYEKEVHNNLGKDTLFSAMMRCKVRGIMVTAVMISVLLSIAGILYLGGQDVANGYMTQGSLVSYIFYSVLVAMSLSNLSDLYSNSKNSINSLSNLFSLLKFDEYVTENTDKKMSIKHNKMEGCKIEFSGVRFSYDGLDTNPSIQDLSFIINPGEKIGLVGRSGAGKSTIFDLLLRFYDIDHGDITINGVSIFQLPVIELRELLGLVDQEAFLFPGTVIENIGYGCKSSSRAEIIKAAQDAYCEEFVKELPEGYDSSIGEGKITLSGGQKQRIAIARAILKNPQILLLDEATSALDAESEYMVQEALLSFMEHRTTIVIAHRLSTILKMDRIFVMDKGRIVDIGTHKELMSRDGIYKNLASLQFSAV